jgi:hypothetical protein
MQNSLVTILCVSLFLLFSLSFMQQIVSSVEDESMPMDVMEIWFYPYDEKKVPDYHTGELAMDGAEAGRLLLINGVVKNLNYAEEHFDYITQISDSDGIVIYVDIRSGVAVPLGHELGIDSDRSIIFNDTGIHVAKVFTWRNIATIPEPLSAGAELEFHVAVLPRGPPYR